MLLKPRDAHCTLGTRTAPQEYYVRIWFNDDGQITAVNLSLGEP